MLVMILIHLSYIYNRFTSFSKSDQLDRYQGGIKEVSTKFDRLKLSQLCFRETFWINY